MQMVAKVLRTPPNLPQAAAQRQQQVKVCLSPFTSSNTLLVSSRKNGSQPVARSQSEQRGVSCRAAERHCCGCRLLITRLAPSRRRGSRRRRSGRSAGRSPRRRRRDRVRRQQRLVTRTRLAPSRGRSPRRRSAGRSARRCPRRRRRDRIRRRQLCRQRLVARNLRMDGCQPRCLCSDLAVGIDDESNKVVDLRCRVLLKDAWQIR